MNLFKKTSWAVAAFFVLFIWSCGTDPKPEPSPSPDPVEVSVPKFNRDSAFSYVKKQVDFGPRLPNTEGHRKTKAWLVEKFKSFGCSVIEQDFKAKVYTGSVFDCTNIMAQYNPSATKRILFAAHWDTRHIADSPVSKERQDEPIDGADDGGSGVGVLLEMARILQSNPADIGVDFLLFDAEDHGDNVSPGPQRESWGLGSQYWSRNIVPAGYRPKYGILLDMVGARNTKFPKEGGSVMHAPQVVEKVWALGKDLGYTRFFSEQRVGEITDDHYFVNTIAKIPMIDVVGMPQVPGAPVAFGPHWHTHNDNIDIIDVRTLKAVGQTMLHVVYKEAAGQF